MISAGWRGLFISGIEELSKIDRRHLDEILEYIINNIELTDKFGEDTIIRISFLIFSFKGRKNATKEYFKRKRYMH